MAIIPRTLLTILTIKLVVLGFWHIVTLSNRLTTQEKARFFYQLAALLNSGMSVQQSLNLAGKDCNSSFRDYLRQLSAALGSSLDLTSALALDRRYFDNWTISLLTLAEYSGSLPQTCRQLAIASEARAKLERLYRSLRLSLLVTSWSLLILTAAIFNPHSTAVIKPEFWLRSLAIALLLLGISFLVSRYSSRGKQRLLMNLPVVGKLFQAQALLHLAQLQLPLSCGVPILTAVELVREHVPDPVMRDNLASTARKVRAGQSLSYSLAGKLPPQALQMIRTGEETGNLDAALQNLAQYYQGELETRLSVLHRSLQPLSLLAIAALVAVVGIRGITVLLNALPD